MNEQSIDALVRRSADVTSRRSSVLALGGAGLTAIFGSALAVDARKRKKKKTVGDQYALCVGEAQQCQSSLPTFGANAAMVTCCQLLATCDSFGFLNCIFTAPPPA